MNQESPTSFWQPSLEGPNCLLRPLHPGDFDPLFEAARDPEVWCQHPVPDRYQRDKFTAFFDDCLNSQGALSIVYKASGQVIGVSRFSNFSDQIESVEIGYTFLAKPFWGTGLNAEIKALMIGHALLKVERVVFYVAECNLRSQRALSKLGIRRLEHTKEAEVGGRLVRAFIFEVNRELWAHLSRDGAPLHLIKSPGPKPPHRI